MAKIEQIKERIKHVRKFAPFMVIGVITIGAAVVLVMAKTESSRLKASGTIEAVQIDIAAQMPGQVAEVLVDEGQEVNEGDLLVVLDSEQLGFQVEQAEAALAQVQANYDLLVAGGQPEQRQAAIAAAELELTAAQQAVDALYENVDIALAEIQAAMARAGIAADDAQTLVYNLQSSSSQADIDAAQATVILARDRLETAQEDFAPYLNKPEDNLTRANLLAAMAAAEQLYDNAVQRLNNLKGTADEYDIALAQSQLARALAELQLAQDKLEEMGNGPDPDALALAQARLKLAEAQLALAQSDPSEEQLALAQAQVDAAAAALALLRSQLDKTAITAPSGGTILYRLIEPGEFTAAGVPVLTLVQLENLTLTVYLPEDRYGEVQLGDEVELRVDSFPAEVFTAEVVRIADEAEFTPRNVQTQEGRRTTVFAVELRVFDDSGRLKPGMPADVDFGS